jgi:hypothetical protein
MASPAWWGGRRPEVVQQDAPERNRIKYRKDIIDIKETETYNNGQSAILKII